MPEILCLLVNYYYCRKNWFHQLVFLNSLAITQSILPKIWKLQITDSYDDWWFVNVPDKIIKRIFLVPFRTKVLPSRIKRASEMVGLPGPEGIDILWTMVTRGGVVFPIPWGTQEDRNQFLRWLVCCHDQMTVELLAAECGHRATPTPLLYNTSPADVLW